jgi:hypothetical protein
MADTSGASNAIKSRGAAVAAYLGGRDPGAPTMTVELVCKDLTTMIAEAKALGGTLPAAETALRCFQEAARGGLADRLDPAAGLVFDGRLVENFKLASGAFVVAGALRVAAVSAIAGAVSDAVVCGEGREGVGLMLFLDPKACLRIGDPKAVKAAIRAGLERLNGLAKGGGKVTRALILDGAPDAASGELTDKGYINQALARERRPAELARLFAEEPDDGVMVFA